MEIALYRIVWECVSTITVLDSAINFAAAKRIWARSNRLIPRGYYDTSRQSASGSGSPGSHFRSRRLVTRNVAFLNNYNIPELVTGGFIAALFLSGFPAASSWAISVELITCGRLLLIFFVLPRDARRNKPDCRPSISFFAPRHEEGMDIPIKLQLLAEADRGGLLSFGNGCQPIEVVRAVFDCIFQMRLEIIE